MDFFTLGVLTLAYNFFKANKGSKNSACSKQSTKNTKSSTASKQSSGLTNTPKEKICGLKNG